ncbi:MAG TPA: amylo-alpha-1,6-glucosidase, partial [Rhodothermales bacterium]|nr:amylo-alpha-1,6-glucosidase [Rhodothermales bacterium]
MRLLLFAFLLVPATLAQPAPRPSLDGLGIEVTKEASRPFVYTDKEAGVFYAEGAGPQTTAWQGFSVRGVTFVDDWAWTEGRTRRTAQHLESARVHPHEAVRRYAGGLRETVVLLEGPASALVVVPAGERPTVFEPLVADRREASAFEVRADRDVLLIAHRSALERPAEGGEAPPVWLAVTAPRARAEVRRALVETGGVDGALFAPGRLVLRGSGAVAMATGPTPEAAATRARNAARDHERLRAQRKARMEALLARTYVETEDTRFNRALAWARLSLDALVMNQHGRGIFAGLPWFNNYWGRDSFISLAGASLVTGQWEEAAEILDSFARYQDTDRDSPTYGRIPNQVSLTGVSYNTADGTPWFVIQADALRRRWANDAFRERFWPIVEHAARGALRRTDDEGFLKHGDQETWMDASAGPGREWSPRGDRAIEVQGLFYEQLRATEAWFQTMGYRSGTQGYGLRAERLREAFERRFRDARTGTYFDHLNEDGTPDPQVRPNVFFALHSFGLDSTAAGVTRDLAAQLVYPWGVASLAQSDSNFHP